MGNQVTHKWGVFELELKSSQLYNDPLRDVSVWCKFVSPSGRDYTVEGFWNGENTWLARFMPDELGVWRYRCGCSNKEDVGLNSVEGSFECIAYEGDNQLYIHGPLRLSPNRRYLVYSDGTPFFWLADTAWNLLLRGEVEEIKEYLEFRRTQGYNVIQFVIINWGAAPTDNFGDRAYYGCDKVDVLNVSFFKRIDEKFALLNKYGFVAAPVLFWVSLEENLRGRYLNPGAILREEEAILLGRYILARYGAHIAVWILNGDGIYTELKANRWRRIGRGIFLNPPTGRKILATMHPRGGTWPLPDFRCEEWYDIVGYQSSHHNERERLRWICQGPPATDWRLDPPRPFINMEPNYEDWIDHVLKVRITRYMVRRAAYWSLLTSPPAGITYGTGGIIVWAQRRIVLESEGVTQQFLTWRESLKLQGGYDMAVLRKIFESIPWWDLVPAQELLVEQPGLDDEEAFIAIAKTSDSKYMVIYNPKEQEVKLNLKNVKTPCKFSWIDPTTGKVSKEETIISETVTLRPPPSRDRISDGSYKDWVIMCICSLN